MEKRRESKLPVKFSSTGKIVDIFTKETFPDQDYFTDSAKIGIESNLKRFFKKLLKTDYSARLPVLFNRRREEGYTLEDYYETYRTKLHNIYSNAFLTLKSCFEGRLIEGVDGKRLLNGPDKTEFYCYKQKILDRFVVIQNQLNETRCDIKQFTRDNPEGMETITLSGGGKKKLEEKKN